MNTFMNRGMAPLGYSILQSALARQGRGAGGGTGAGGGSIMPTLPGNISAPPMNGPAPPTGGVQTMLNAPGARAGGGMGMPPGGIMGLLSRMFRPGMGGGNPAVGAPLSLQPPGVATMPGGGKANSLFGPENDQFLWNGGGTPVLDALGNPAGGNFLGTMNGRRFFGQPSVHDS